MISLYHLCENMNSRIKTTFQISKNEFICGEIVCISRTETPNNLLVDVLAANGIVPLIVETI